VHEREISESSLSHASPSDGDSERTLERDAGSARELSPRPAIVDSSKETDDWDPVVAGTIPKRQKPHGYREPKYPYKYVEEHF
jgi:hypothetical protein